MKPLNTMQDRAYRSAECCYLCKRRFTVKNHKTRDHDHFSGQFLGTACSECNLARRLPRKPTMHVVFHNLRGYDMHHILRHAVSSFGEWELSCIPQTSEKFLALICRIKGKGVLRFIDSLQFLNSSLDAVSKTLDAASDDDFQFTKRNVKELPDKLKFQKGFFPYSYLTCEDVLDEDSLPDREAFYNDLDETHISPQQYALAQEAWRASGCETLYDYLRIYLRLDCNLLPDVFCKFRQVA